jgi:hypothetical protein
MARILAIEPDPVRGMTLERLVSEHLGAEVVLMSSAGDALDTLADVPPDVILTSSLLAPGEDEQLAAHLRAAPELDHLPVLTIPPLLQLADAPPAPKRSLWARLFRIRRRQEPWPPYDFAAIASRIEEALEQSKDEIRESEIERPARLFLLDTRRPLLLEAGRPHVDERRSTALVRYGELPTDDDLGRWSSRSRRWSGQDLPWLAGIELTSGTPSRPTLRLLNMSSTGLLVESNVRMAAGHKAGFHLAGSDREQLVVQARVVRADPSDRDQSGVTHVVAAKFDRPFDSLGLIRSLGDLRRSQGTV